MGIAMLCNGFFYFDELNNYHCVNKCPENSNKIIYEKKNFINECQNDNLYKYEYNNACYQNCPSDSHFLFNLYCIYKIINNKNIFLELIKNKVINNINVEELFNKNDLTFKNQEVIYPITTKSNQNNNLLKNDITLVNLSDCIYKLKDK